MREIPLTKNKVALVDDGDFERLNQYTWKAFKRHNNWNAVRHVGETMFYMHRDILGLSYGDGTIVDHINGNGLDNQRDNLRLCSVKENIRNQHTTCGSSRYKGVSWSKQRDRWRATIMVDRRHKHLGFFDNELDAAVAYDIAAMKYFGEFSFCNFEMAAAA